MSIDKLLYWKVRAGIYSSLRQIVDKKVLPSLSPLFDNQRLDRELRAMLKVN
jgi:integrator complex subunit 3